MSGRRYSSDVNFQENQIGDFAIDSKGRMVPSGTVELPDGTSIQSITSTQKKWVSEFGGIEISPERWDIVTDVGGMTDIVSNGSLAVNMGTNANAEFAILSKEIFTIPFDMAVVARFSQRIANQEVFFELVEVDDDGNVVANPFKAGDANNRASFLFDGATSTTFKAETVSTNSPIAKTISVGSGQSSASDSDWWIEARPEDIWFLAVSSDNAGAKSSAGARISSTVPSPTRKYKIRLRFRNGATAPASATTVTVSRVLVMDIQELQAQIVGGRGDNTSGKAIPTLIVGGTATVQTSVSYVSETSTNLGANASYGGTSRDTGSSPATRKIATHVETDQAGTLITEFSDDGTTWWKGMPDVVVAAATPVNIEFNPVTRYYRHRYTNGATAQTRFRIRSAQYRV